MPSAFTQTKEALMGIDDSTFKLIKVPVQKPEKSTTDVTSYITIEDDMFKVTEKRLLTGYEKVDFITDYLYKKDTKTEEEFLNTTLALGNNKTSYDNIIKNNFDNKKEALELSYDLSIDNYVKKVGTKLFINLDLDRVLSKSKIDEDKKYDKKIDHTYLKDYFTTLTIPEGYFASFIPETLSFENPNYGYTITYTQKDNTIIQHKTIYVNTLSVKKQDFESWNEFIKSLLKAYKKSIILELK
jgi:hypothetical protein